MVLEPRPEIFSPAHWPSQISHESLAPYFERAKRMLGAAPAPCFRAPTDDRALPAPLAVTFGESGSNMVNRFGVPMRGCNGCGNCVTGCNWGAKNTLVTNYLPLARARGARLITRVEVESILPGPPGGPAWELEVSEFVGQAPWMTRVRRKIQANSVFLCAGVLGTLKILLRSRERGTLRLSFWLGKGISGNADGFSVALGKRGSAPQDPGPTIQSYVDLRGEGTPALMLQEGVVPAALRPLIDKMRLLKTETGARPKDDRVWLTMGVDRSEGEAALSSGGKLQIRWRGAGRDEALRAADTLMRRLSQQTGAAHLANPRELSFVLGGEACTPISVHPLGGCRMGDDPDRGVVDDCGRVYSSTGETLRGLYVLDGSVCDSSLGVNPLLTISALAERAAEKLLVQDFARRPAGVFHASL